MSVHLNRRDRRNHNGTTARRRPRERGSWRLVGVDSKSSAPAPSVRARRDRESPSALRLRYGGGSVTRIVASTVSKAPLRSAGWSSRPVPSSVPVGSVSDTLSGPSGDTRPGRQIRMTCAQHYHLCSQILCQWVFTMSLPALIGIL
jgi:hypothetical protein